MVICCGTDEVYFKMSAVTSCFCRLAASSSRSLVVEIILPLIAPYTDLEMRELQTSDPPLLPEIAVRLHWRPDPDASSSSSLILTLVTRALTGPLSENLNRSRDRG